MRAGRGMVSLLTSERLEGKRHHLTPTHHCSLTGPAPARRVLAQCQGPARGGGTALALLVLLSLAAPPLDPGGGGGGAAAFIRARNFELARLPVRFGAFSGGGPGTAASGGGAIMAPTGIADPTVARPASGGGGGGASDAFRSRGGGGGTIDPRGKVPVRVKHVTGIESNC